MRTAFIETLCEVAAQDERIWLLTGDLGYSVLERFAQRFPERFVNVGVAEQNMTGVAAGLALCGKIVFTYSIANFPIMRCLEQIRNDVCYHNLNVKIVAVGGGLAYGSQGYTHHAVEDLAVMRAMPNMTVIAPGDPVETRLATRAIVEWPGPCYLRLGKAGEPVVHQTPPEFAVGRAIPVREGRDVTLIATGGVLYAAVRAADALHNDGIQAGVLSMPTVKPLDEAAVLAAAQESQALVVVEEHSAIGGLGDQVLNVLARARLSAPVRHMALPDGGATISGEEGRRPGARLTPEAIRRVVLSLLFDGRG
jgi:transketolase